jgi:hypothetical protein
VNGLDRLRIVGAAADRGDGDERGCDERPDRHERKDASSTDGDGTPFG